MPGASSGYSSTSAVLADLPVFKWFLAQTGFSDWEGVRAVLADPVYEKRSADGSSMFYNLLTARATAQSLLPATLSRYDAAVLLDWDAIVRRRVAAWGRPRLKYFQYLCLLAVEHFLTRLRDDSPGLLVELNRLSEAAPYTEHELRKLAVSIATGAGKTLLMHVNIRQWLRLIGRDTVDAVILITPSELLSRQHLGELQLSGIDASLFDPINVSLFDNDAQVKVIDINKFRETRGPRTVAVESFGTRNLVLIDEAHRGSRSDDLIWKHYRDRLSRDGYAFEYSATFRQAVAASGDVTLCKEYEKAIIFDYAYREYWNDGFGKDFRVRNADFTDNSEEAALYFVAALLMFFQQQVVFDRDRIAAKASSIETPLLLAVGTTVQKVDSDIVNLLVRFRDFIEHRTESIGRIKRLLENETALVSDDGCPLVFSDLGVLRESFVTVDKLYDAIRRGVFHAGVGGAVRLTRFAGVPGEIHLSVDSGKPFGLVNVGDASSLFLHLTRDVGFVGFDEPGSSARELFDEVSGDGSSVTVLIGARKFIEGWDSNRPSSMLLLNVGRREGTQLIQLFGRGVRLRGYDGSLTRSSRDVYRPPAPKSLHLLETLELFGIRADYIRRLRSTLDVEDIGKAFVTESTLEPTVSHPKSSPLTVVRAEGISYSEAHSEVAFDALSDKLQVTLDWYPRVLSYGSIDAGAEAVERRTVRLSDRYLAFIDLDEVYTAMLGYKRSRRWDNLVIHRRTVNDLFASDDWYILYASEEALRPSNLSSIRTWQNIAESLAVAYLSEWYRTRLREHEAGRLRS